MQSQLVCNGCRRLLLYPRGATNVCCALCNTITSVPPPGSMPIAEGAVSDLFGRPLFFSLYDWFLEHGGVYKLAFGPKAFVVVSDPVVARHILRENAFSYEQEHTSISESKLIFAIFFINKSAFLRTLTEPLTQRSAKTVENSGNIKASEIHSSLSSKRRIRISAAPSLLNKDLPFNTFNITLTISSVFFKLFNPSSNLARRLRTAREVPAKSSLSVPFTALSSTGTAPARTVKVQFP